jgi:hypothetical protein
MTALYLKMRIATLEFEIAMIDARMLQQNSDGLKSNKVELETRVFVIQLNHSQVVMIFSEDLNRVFHKILQSSRLISWLPVNVLAGNFNNSRFIL